MYRGPCRHLIKRVVQATGTGYNSVVVTKSGSVVSNDEGLTGSSMLDNESPLIFPRQSMGTDNLDDLYKTTGEWINPIGIFTSSSIMLEVQTPNNTNFSNPGELIILFARRSNTSVSVPVGMLIETANGQSMLFRAIKKVAFHCNNYTAQIPLDLNQLDPFIKLTFYGSSDKNEQRIAGIDLITYKLIDDKPPTPPEPRTILTTPILSSKAYTLARTSPVPKTEFVNSTRLLSQELIGTSRYSTTESIKTPKKKGKNTPGNVYYERILRSVMSPTRSVSSPSPLLGTSLEHLYASSPGIPEVVDDDESVRKLNDMYLTRLKNIQSLSTKQVPINTSLDSISRSQERQQRKQRRTEPKATTIRSTFDETFTSSEVDSQNYISSGSVLTTYCVDHSLSGEGSHEVDTARDITRPVSAAVYKEQTKSQQLSSRSSSSYSSRSSSSSSSSSSATYSSSSSSSQEKHHISSSQRHHDTRPTGKQSMSRGDVSVGSVPKVLEKVPLVPRHEGRSMSRNSVKEKSRSHHSRHPDGTTQSQMMLDDGEIPNISLGKSTVPADSGGPDDVSLDTLVRDLVGDAPSQHSDGESRGASISQRSTRPKSRRSRAANSISLSRDVTALAHKSMSRHTQNQSMDPVSSQHEVSSINNTTELQHKSISIQDRQSSDTKRDSLEDSSSSNSRHSDTRKEVSQLHPAVAVAVAVAKRPEEHKSSKNKSRTQHTDTPTNSSAMSEDKSSQEDGTESGKQAKSGESDTTSRTEPKEQDGSNVVGETLAKTKDQAQEDETQEPKQEQGAEEEKSKEETEAPPAKPKATVVDTTPAQYIQPLMLLQSPNPGSVAINNSAKPAKCVWYLALPHELNSEYMGKLGSGQSLIMPKQQPVKSPSFVYKQSGCLKKPIFTALESIQDMSYDGAQPSGKQLVIRHTGGSIRLLAEPPTLRLVLGIMTCVGANMAALSGRAVQYKHVERAELLWNIFRTNAAEMISKLKEPEPEQPPQTQGTGDNGADKSSSDANTTEKEHSSKAPSAKSSAAKEEEKKDKEGSSAELSSFNGADFNSDEKPSKHSDNSHSSHGSHGSHSSYSSYSKSSSSAPTHKTSSRTETSEEPETEGNKTKGISISTPSLSVHSSPSPSTRDTSSSRGEPSGSRSSRSSRSPSPSTSSGSSDSSGSSSIEFQFNERFGE